MLSVLFCSRVKNNPDSNVKTLLDSAVDKVRGPEREQIEFLIKYDDDDPDRPPDSFFDRYPFPIRRFVWSRGECRHYLHHAQEYLFAQRDRFAHVALARGPANVDLPVVHALNIERARAGMMCQGCP